MGKLNTVKDEMTRLHIDNLGISKLKWTGIGHLQSENHTVYYLGHKKTKKGCFESQEGYSKDSTWVQKSHWPSQTLQT